MYKLYNVTKKKTSILGLWQDENKKIFRDNILIKEFSNYRRFQLGIKKLFSQGEKAVFYEKIGLAFIENENGKIDILSNKTIFQVLKLKTSFIKKLLSNYGGLTVFKNEGYKNGYKIKTGGRKNEKTFFMFMF